MFRHDLAPPAITLIASILACGPALASNDSAPATSSSSTSPDLARMQGEWTTLAGPDHDIVVFMRVEDVEARLTITLPTGLRLEARAQLALDPTSQPPRLDWKEVETADGQTLPNILGIYRLDPDSPRLTICTGGPLGARPSTFQPGDSALAALVTFERPAIQTPPQSSTDTSLPPLSSSNPKKLTKSDRLDRD